MCFGARIVESCVVKLTAGVCVQCVGVNEGSPQASRPTGPAEHACIASRYIRIENYDTWSRKGRAMELHSPPAPTNLIVLKNSSTSWVAPLPVYLFRLSSD
jgi:hypothetical protein